MYNILCIYKNYVFMHRYTRSSACMYVLYASKHVGIYSSVCAIAERPPGVASCHRNTWEEEASSSCD